MNAGRWLTHKCYDCGNVFTAKVLEDSIVTCMRFTCGSNNLATLAAEEQPNKEPLYPRIEHEEPYWPFNGDREAFYNDRAGRMP